MSEIKSDPPRLNPTELYLRRNKRIRWLVILGLLVVILIYVASCFSGAREYGNAEMHFKYGSIGSDIENGLPVDILSALPALFPEYLPESNNSPKDLTAFGFVVEPGRELPIGFSLRKRGVRLTGLNCASCHTGVVRDSARSPGVAVVGMPSNQLRIQQFFGFLFDCASDPRFTPDYIIDGMRRHGIGVGPVSGAVYRQVVIPQLQKALLLRRDQTKEFFAKNHPRWGAGRVDTFNPYKRIQFAEHFKGKPIPAREIIGTADFPSLWNQRIRDGMELHWDGNNSSVFERNMSASFGAGATRENIDLKALDRIKNWIFELPPPRFEDYFGWKIDRDAVGRGKAVFDQKCFDCHDPKGRYVGKPDPIDQINTSRFRLDSYTAELAKLQLEYGQGYHWQWKNFHKTQGYANAPLDGIWARAPYLHNGSVPTMWDLLTPEKERSQEPFFRGHGVIDTRKLGIRTDIDEAGGMKSWKYSVSLDGNKNHGHSGPRYGTDLTDAQKWDLIEYLKTL